MANPFSRFFFGTPEKRENVSTLRPEQEGLYQQLINAGRTKGVGGAFGQASDYYRNLLSDDSADYDAFAAPALRQYHQDIIPGIAEQFASYGGSGSLSGSGFRNAQIQGATDLSERLAQIRANLRQSGAQGLSNIGQLGLQNFSQNMVTQPGTPGLLSNVSQGIGNGISQGFGPAIGNALSGLGSWFGTSGNRVGQNSPPYGQNQKASPSIPPMPQRMQLPNFSDISYGQRFGGY